MARISAVDRRAELIRAALRVAATRGIAATTTRAVVAEAGMSLASFHYAFASRDEMLAELVAHVVEQERVVLDVGDLMDAAPDGRPPQLRSIVHAGLTRYFELLRFDPGREAAMQELSYYAMRTPGLEALAGEQYRRYAELAGEALVLAAELSASRWRLPVDELARIVVSFTDGLTAAWLVRRDDAEALQLIDAVASLIVSLAEPRER